MLCVIKLTKLLTPITEIVDNEIDPVALKLGVNTAAAPGILVEARLIELVVVGVQRVAEPDTRLKARVNAVVKVVVNNVADPDINVDVIEPVALKEGVKTLAVVAITFGLIPDGVVTDGVY